MSIFNDLANDKTTPEFSRQLAKAVNAPLFANNPPARESFASQATQYPTLDAMPTNLQSIYRRAMASRPDAE